MISKMQGVEPEEKEKQKLMAASEPKLTIAIPTYNRLQKLKRTLAQALTLSKGKPVEVLVSDNGSTDGTREYLQSISQAGVRCYFNEQNLGCDRNFLNCFDKANGKYVMLLGDDDLLLEEGLCSILEAIEKEPVFIHTNTCGLTEDGNEILNAETRSQNEEKLLVYRDKNEFLQRVGVHITFVSSLVFRTEYVREIKDREQYIGTYFIQSHIALRTMEHEGCYIVDTVNCCAATGNVMVAYDLFYVWGKCFGDLLYQTAVKSGFDENIVDKVAHRAFENTILGFVWVYRKTCQDADTWDRSAVWSYVKRYPDLQRSFTWAMNCPRWLIPVAMRGDRLILKLKNTRY